MDSLLDTLKLVCVSQVAMNSHVEKIVKLKSSRRATAMTRLTKKHNTTIPDVC